MTGIWRMGRRLLPPVLFLAALVLFVAWATVRVTPEGETGYGMDWDRFLAEEEQSIDVLVAGSSIAYSGVIPAMLYEEGDVSAYVTAGPVQTFVLTYFYLREALKTQSPRVVVVETSALFFESAGQYSGVNVERMPWSINRVMAALLGTEGEARMNALFPLYAYHDRFPGSAKAVSDPDPLAGYTLLGAGDGEDPDPVRDAPAESGEIEENLRWLERIVDLCDKNGIQVVLYSAPTRAQYPEETQALLEGEMAGLAEREGVTYYCLSDAGDSMGLDPETDFFDGSHMSVGGAEKFSAYLGRLLAEAHGVPEAENPALWAERLAYYRELVDGGM